MRSKIYHNDTRYFFRKQERETLVVTGREYFLIEFNYHRFPAVFRETRDASSSLRTELSGSPVNENLRGREEKREEKST